MKTTLLVLVAFAAVLPGLAQETAPRTNAPSTNTPPRMQSAALVSPEVHKDRTVTFRLRAPNAKEVKVAGEWPGGASNLTKEGDVWVGKVGPLEPDMYGYSLVVDGLSMVDPANPRVKPMRQMRTSIVEIPGETPRHWEFQDVPHGSVHEHHYFSKALQTKRRLHVYTPPGYEKSREKLPVLYLFHGSGDNDATWIDLGHAHFTADNLIAAKKAKPMIIVMTDGHAYTQAPSPGMTNSRNRNVEAFRSDLLKDVIPLIESTYRVKADRKNRAIVGLSMGGGQSLFIGMKDREMFSWVGGMSSALPEPERVVGEAFPNGKSDLSLLWIACGKDDRLIGGARDLAAALKKRNIPHQFLETEGNHSWPVWRKYFDDFMPLLFVSKK